MRQPPKELIVLGSICEAGSGKIILATITPLRSTGTCNSLCLSVLPVDKGENSLIFMSYQLTLHFSGEIEASTVLLKILKFECLGYDGRELGGG